MHAFLCFGRARSVNARKSNKTDEYTGRIQKAFFTVGSGLKVTAPQYGIVYYFHSKPTQLDADNLSKPVWDALVGFAYEDDKLIKLRHAGMINIKEDDYSSINLTSLPDSISEAFIEALGDRHDFIYVEFGNLKMDMYSFGKEQL